MSSTAMTTASRNVAMTAHFTGALAAFFLPSFGWIGPAFIWALNQKDPEVVSHAREAFKFQFAMAAAAWVVGLVGAALSCFLFGPLIWFAALVPWLSSIVCGVIAGVSVNNRQRYAYPVTGDPYVIR